MNFDRIRPAMTFQEIADEMGITHQRVHQIYDRAIRKMVQHSQREDIRSLLDGIEARREYARPRSSKGKPYWTVSG